MNIFAATSCFRCHSCRSLALAADKPRVSPHETITADIDGATVTIVYGRLTPRIRRARSAQNLGRAGSFGKVWRTGADEATLLTTTQPLDIGAQASRLERIRFSRSPNKAVPRN